MSTEERLSKLEHDLAELKDQVAQEAGLRASMDSDVASLSGMYQAQRRMLQALADTQSEHTTQLTRLDARTEVMTGQLNTIVTMLTTLIDRGPDPT